MTDEQLTQKFRGLAGRKLSEERLQAVLDRVWRLDGGGSLASLFESVRMT